MRLRMNDSDSWTSTYWLLSNRSGETNLNGWTTEGSDLIVLKVVFCMKGTRGKTCHLPSAGAAVAFTLSPYRSLQMCRKSTGLVWPLYFFNNITVVSNMYRQLTDTPEQRVSDDSPLFMTVMWWNSKPSVHLHLDLPQTTLYLDPAVDLHNWSLWPGACYSLTWHHREADGEMYWTDCSSLCRVRVAMSWQKRPEENGLATQRYEQHYI